MTKHALRTGSELRPSTWRRSAGALVLFFALGSSLVVVPACTSPSGADDEGDVGDAELRRRKHFDAGVDPRGGGSVPGSDAGVTPSSPGTGTGGSTTPAATSASCAPLPAPTGRVVDVTDVASLVAAVNNAQQGDTIRLADGNYAMNGNYLWISRPGITLRSKSGDREKVVIDGGYNQGAGQSVVTIGASNVTVAHLTVARAYDHPIHVDASGGDVTGAMIYDVHVLDPGQQAIKANGDEPGFSHFAEQGTVACSHLELTDAGRGHVRDNCYTGGVDAHSGRGWVVRDNLIEGFWCASGLSEHGIHFWKGARDMTIERNVIKDSARGIGLGLGEATQGRTFGDNPCSGVNNVGVFGGVVRNNFVMAESAGLFASAAGFDSGIALEVACKTSVLHNTVASTKAPSSSSIEWRFAGTSVTLTNNLATATLRARDGAAGTLGGNVDSAPLGIFANVAAGDLHLLPTATQALDRGVPVPGGLCTQDIDGTTRSTQSPDVGADEVP